MRFYTEIKWFYRGTIFRHVSFHTIKVGPRGGGGGRDRGKDGKEIRIRSFTEYSMKCICAVQSVDETSFRML